MKPEQIIEIIKQVIHNPQVSPPPITYSITEKNVTIPEYTSDYIDVDDFKSFMERLEKQLISRFNN